MPIILPPVQQIAVPAYFPLNTLDPQGRNCWDLIRQANGVVSIVVPEASFPTLKQDNPPVWQLAQQQFHDCQTAGQLVFGYVDSKYGQVGAGQSITDAISAIMASVGVWMDAYSGQTNGIFFDNGPSFESGPPGADDNYFRAFYAQALRQVMRSAYPALKIMLNAAGYPYE